MIKGLNIEINSPLQPLVTEGIYDHLFYCQKESNRILTKRPLLIQTPLREAVHQLDLVVLATCPPGGLEDLDACGQPYVVFVVVTPGS